MAQSLEPDKSNFTKKNSVGNLFNGLLTSPGPKETPTGKKQGIEIITLGGQSEKGLI